MFNPEVSGQTSRMGGSAGALGAGPMVADATVEGGANRRPRGSLWLVYLFLRPGTFFRHFVVDSVPLLTAISAWLYGMAGVIERIETRFQWKSRPSDLTGEAWPAYWAAVAFGGLVAGVFYYAAGGWWYRVRLRWSGAENPDPNLARRVYLFASLVVALPVLLVTVVETSIYPTPRAAYASEGSWWYLVFLLTPFWSTWNSYVGVRTAFVVRRKRALTWFLLLPALFYSLAFIGVFVVLMFAPANVSSPAVHDSATLRFSYPGNWWIDTDDPDYDPAHNLHLEAMQEAFLHIALYESDLPLEGLRLRATEGYQEIMSGVRDAGPVNRWGRYRGLGRVQLGETDGEFYRFEVFISPVAPGRYLEVQEFCAESDRTKVLPGFELIRSTFLLKE